MNLNIQHIEIQKNLTDFEKLQHEHLSVLENNSIPDLAQMTRDRSSRFSEIKSQIDRFIENAGRDGIENIDVLTGFEKQIQIIMELDRQISDKIEQHRSVLSDNLKKMKAGKTAMKGYSNSNTLYQQPRVLSMNR